MINVKSRTYTAAQADTWGVNATFVRCLAGNASFRIEGFWKGTKLLDFDGFQAGLSVGEILTEQAVGEGGVDLGGHKIAQFDSFIVTNGATPQTIVLAYGDGDVTDNRLVGTVNITGGILSKPIGADTFVAGGIKSAIITTGKTIPGVAQGATITLQNIGTGKISVAHKSTTAANGILLDNPGVGVVGGASIELSAALTWRITGVTKSKVAYIQTKFA